MKKLLLVFGIVFAALSLSAQMLRSIPPGGNKKALVGEQIGITKVMINYDRPGVKGREGKIYGTAVVHKGFVDLGFGTSKAAPWRAGANENTTIEFSTDVKIEGKDLAAGIYGFFIAFDPDECTLIFSKNSTSWGSFFYNDKEDVLRVKVKPVALDRSVEWLKYEFMDQTDSSAIIALHWEKLMIPFRVQVDLVKTRLDNYRMALRNKDGFRAESCEEAAFFCLQHNTNLEEGRQWAQDAVNFGGGFSALSTYASFLERSGKNKGADSVMRLAYNQGNMIELHQYGRKLISQKKNKEALEVFVLNSKKNPNQFTTYVGLARGYSANGDHKTALKNAKLALPLSPDANNTSSVQTMISKLEKGTDIN